MSLLKKFNLLSVNQLSAQIKLVEVWKTINVENHPLTLDPYNLHVQNNTRDLRPQHNRVFNDSYKLQISSHSFNTDAARLWNLAPDQVRTATTLSAAKSAILKHVTSLPVLLMTGTSELQNTLKMVPLCPSILRTVLICPSLRRKSHNPLFLYTHRLLLVLHVIQIHCIADLTC